MVNVISNPITQYNVYFENRDFMEFYDDMQRSIGYTEINKSAGISKTDFRTHKVFTILGKYFRINNYCLYIEVQNGKRVFTIFFMAALAVFLCSRYQTCNQSKKFSLIHSFQTIKTWF